MRLALCFIFHCGGHHRFNIFQFGVGRYIAALIAKKRELLENVVKEDDPGLLKSFTREELIELMDMPADTK